MTDSARIALTMWKTRGDDLTYCVKKSNHAQYLEQIGFNEDIEFCCRQDVSTVVPMLVTEEGRNILRSASGSARPYPKPLTISESRITPPAPIKKADPFEELLSYTRKKD